VKRHHLRCSQTCNPFIFFLPEFSEVFFFHKCTHLNSLRFHKAPHETRRKKGTKRKRNVEPRQDKEMCLKELEELDTTRQAKKQGTLEVDTSLTAVRFFPFPPHTRLHPSLFLLPFLD